MKCINCLKEFDETYFYRDRSRPNGRKPRCKTCEKLYKNHVLRREYEKKYRQENPEKRRMILRSWYNKNKDHHNKVQSKYRATEQFRANHRNHYAKRRASIKAASIGKVDYIEIYNNSGGMCFYCGEKISFDDCEFDHYIPISKGGEHSQDNLRCSCMACNRKKGAQLPKKEVYYQMV